EVSAPSAAVFDPARRPRSLVTLPLPPASSPLFPYTTLFRSAQLQHRLAALEILHLRFDPALAAGDSCGHRAVEHAAVGKGPAIAAEGPTPELQARRDIVGRNRVENEAGEQFGRRPRHGAGGA